MAMSLAACSAMDTPRTAWEKHPIDEVIALWGAPSTVEPLENGGNIYTWAELKYGKNGAIKKCSKVFVTNAKGLIKSGPDASCHKYSM